MNHVHMHHFRIACNKTLIASFPTKHQAVAFVRERANQFKGNDYQIVERQKFGE